MKRVAPGEQSEGWGPGPRPPSRFGEIGGKKGEGARNSLNPRRANFFSPLFPGRGRFPAAGAPGLAPGRAARSAAPPLRRRAGREGTGRAPGEAGGGRRQAGGQAGRPAGRGSRAPRRQGRAEASRAAPPPAVPEHVGAGGGDLPAGEGAVLPAPAWPPGPRGAAAAQGEARRHHGFLRHPQDDFLQSECPPSPQLRGQGGRAGGAEDAGSTRVFRAAAPRAETCRRRLGLQCVLPGRPASAWWRLLMRNTVCCLFFFLIYCNLSYFDK